MSLCKHLKYFESSYYTKICCECGLEVNGYLSIEATYTQNLPLNMGYSRTKRFRQMLLSIVDPTKHCSMDGRTQVLLGDRKFENVTELLKALKRVKSKNKQYSSLHLYAIRYVNNHISPPAPHKPAINIIMSEFYKIENGHDHNFRGDQFFSYRWLLEKLLRKHGFSQFCVYVKKLQNAKSIEYYEGMYKTVMNSCNVIKAPGNVSMIPQSPVELLDDGLSQLSPWSLLLNYAKLVRSS